MYIHLGEIAVWTGTMRIDQVIPGLLHPNPCFLCKDLSRRNVKTLFRVPLAHLPLEALRSEGPEPELAQAVLDELPDIESARQLRAIIGDGRGLGLWVPRQRGKRDLNELPDKDQFAPDASVLIFPPHELSRILDELSDWCFDGVEAAFEGLPYGFDEIQPFAGIQSSPDLWYLVLRGPMAGQVCWWTHDGDCVMDRAWANDVKDWAARLFAEAPDVLGGTVRFEASQSIDAAPPDAELFPVEYVDDGRKLA